MSSFENNAFFWQKLDTLYFSSKLVIDRPKFTCHYKYSNLIYPVDYGYLHDTTGNDQVPIDVFYLFSHISHNIDLFQYKYYLILIA